MASQLTPVGFQYAVAALQKKRAELDGDIAQLKLQLRDRRRDLGKVDDILRILAPGKDPTAIPPKKPARYLNVFRQGELGRLIIGLLRVSTEPMTNLEIAKAIMQRGGYRSHLWTAIRRRTRANLAYLEAQGRVTRTGTGIGALWKIVA
ncbi:MAG TPA: hypothetical protein VFI23_06595 [Rhizomicrobium sp.]|nr:hypothetical protein [Rhizomicrobium sp.]